MLTEDQSQRVSKLLAKHTGLHFPLERRRELEHGLAHAASEAGFSNPAEFVDSLLASPFTLQRLDLLARHVTIGETYFFRDPQLMTALEQYVLPELIERCGATDKRLRIWSAGCCSGEEPYTIAMLLDRLLPNQSGWDISILGTDINVAFLEKADAGIYREWSLRATPEKVRRRYFRSLRDGRFELKPEIRKRVSFHKLNLAGGGFPSPATGTVDIDLLLCRNVLMYFTAETARTAGTGLARALAKDGWLATSPSEALNELFGDLTRVTGTNTILYRKLMKQPALPEERPGVSAPPGAQWPVDIVPENRGGATTRLTARQGSSRVLSGGYSVVSAHTRLAAPLPALTRPRSLTTTSVRTVDDQAAGSIARDGVGNQLARTRAPEGTSSEILAETARARAAEGSLDEAIRACRQAIELQPLDPALRYLLAVLELEHGKVNRAVRALNQAIYLDPSAILPHVALANLRKEQGRFSEALRHFDTARRLLTALGDEEIVVDSDGLPAAQLSRLLEAARSHTRSLSQQSVSGRLTT